MQFPDDFSGWDIVLFQTLIFVFVFAIAANAAEPPAWQSGSATGALYLTFPDGHLVVQTADGQLAGAGARLVPTPDGRSQGLVMGRPDGREIQRQDGQVVITFPGGSTTFAACAESTPGCVLLRALVHPARIQRAVP